jgi:hypothetical protein
VKALSQRTRQRLAAFFLTVAVAMLVCGLTLWERSFSPVGFLIYWTVCLVFTALAAIVALLEMVAIGEKSRRKTRELVKETWSSLNETEAKSEIPSKNSGGRNATP